MSFFILGSRVRNNSEVTAAFGAAVTSSYGVWAAESPAALDGRSGAEYLRDDTVVRWLGGLLKRDSHTLKGEADPWTKAIVAGF